MLSMAGLRGGGCQELRGTERYDYIRFLREAAEIVALNPLRGAPIRDVSDMVVMQTVVIGEADFLCTRDQDFYTPEVLTYLEGMGTKVLDDVALIHRLRP
jgi:predicted nucleic acid-binding protein